MVVRHRARSAVDAVVSLPRSQASLSASGGWPFHRRYQAWYWRRHLERFFSPLVDRGDLVFDVGANRGLWTSALTGLGCRVVAIEPQADCAEEIARTLPVTVIVAAVGAEAGETDLFLGRHSAMASTSAGWMRAMVEQGGVPADFWSSSTRVQVRTLDDLIDEFGEPAYIKLDVEGSESEALAGLTRPVRLVSFETHGQTRDDARLAVARLIELGRYEFNLSPGEFQQLQWADWRAEEDVLRALGDDRFGWNNVFARLPSG